MHKKILLAISVFIIAAGAFYVFSRGDRPTRTVTDGQGVEVVRQFVSVPTTQGTQSLGESQMPISPGDQSKVIVYDENTGRPKYQFEAKGWKPINDTDYHVDELLITIYMPRGETTYISADQADVTLAQKTKNRVDAQRGTLKGNVRVVIDRTTADWRRENPELAEMAQHPDDLIRIELDSARFDMDRAELISESGVVVDSREARIEDVSDLTVNWNQVDNRVEVLQFAKGGKMTIRRGANMVEFGLPGEERKRKTADVDDEKLADTAKDMKPSTITANAPTVVGEIEPDAQGRIPLARANEPMSVDSVSANEAAAEIRVEGARFMANTPQSIYGDEMEPTPEQIAEAQSADKLRTADALATDLADIKREAQTGMADASAKEAAAPPVKDATGATLPAKKSKRVHTYRAVFKNDVVVEQLRDGKSVGRMDASELEVHFDFGSKQREIATGGSAVKANQPTFAGEVIPDAGNDSKSAEAGAVPPSASRSDIAAARADADEDDGSEQIVLTWDGPLDLRPLFVPPDEQTGKRFDVIAVGTPVLVKSEKGNAICNQLVYRGERKQVWLMGAEEMPVEMSVDVDRRLSGREIFFDRRRGLGRVDGPGYMIDKQTPKPKQTDETAVPEGTVKTLALPGAGETKIDKKPADPVEIRWTRGVDLEIGTRPVERISSKTGKSELRDKEYLRRAWFHGDVRFKRGDEKLASDEVAATFGVPAAEDQDASDFIEHLNMSGDVNLERGDDLIEAEKLDVVMARAADGRSSPRTVDAVGNVLAKQGGREIRASVMRVTLDQYPVAPRLAPDGKTLIPSKPRLGMESLDATGGVFAVDPAHNMKIRDAESLKARLRNGDELVKIDIISPKPEIFAKARFQDMAIHGHKIDIDADQQSVDVPGPGDAWMVTYEDFGGRRLKKPTAVKTSWTGSMQLRLGKDYGVFNENVRSISPTFAMNCDKLTVRLGKAPEKPKKARGQDFLDRFAILGEITNDKADLEFNDKITVNMDQKRPVYVVAEGNAEALSSTFAPTTAYSPRGRLLSRARIAGKQIVADLRNEQMSVPCEGTLLIEDYQFEDTQGKAQKRRSAQVSGPMMSSMRGEGPSQTLIEWENAMDFFVDRALVAFDKNVRMLHLSGQQVVLRDELATAFKLNTASLRRISEGRHAELTCGNLLLEFATGKQTSESKDPSGATQLVQATDLERLIARDAVHMQDGTKSLMGEYLQYLSATNEVRLEGGAELDARIIDQAEGGRFNMWRGPLLIWNRATNAIQSPKSTVTTSGR
ncbi:MAG: hypothetical protein IPK83_05345 [Planctomycetes bacterium]|nr:hypothetical protein [Planctomycetota bacterium]